MVKLPPEIQKQVDAVDALYQQPAAQESAAPAPESVPMPTPTATPEAQAPAPDNPAPAESAPPVSEQIAPRSAPLPEAPPKPSRSSEESWEQRYKTLQGMHNQNTADLKRRLEQERSEKAALAERLAKMEESTNALAQPAIDPKHTESFGEDLVGMVHAVVRSYLEQNSNQYDNRIKNLGDKVATVTQEAAKNADELFLERLQARVSDVAAVNTDPGFLAWLAELDPFYGVTRQAALDMAAQARDVNRVALIFEAYKKTQVPPSPAAPQSPPPRANAPNTQLEIQAAPRAGVSAAPPVQPAGDKRRFSSADVTRFYDAVRRGEYRGRPDELARAEQEINRALAEGRIAV